MRTSSPWQSETVNWTLRGILRLLDQVEYEGALALEIEPEDIENLPRYVAEAYVYLKRLLTDVTGKSVE